MIREIAGWTIVLVVGGMLVWAITLVLAIPRPPPPTCEKYGHTPREYVPARCFSDFRPERP